MSVAVEKRGGRLRSLDVVAVECCGRDPERAYFVRYERGGLVLVRLVACGKLTAVARKRVSRWVSAI